MLFEVTHGVHHDSNAVGVTLCDVKGVDRTKSPHTFYPGDVIESKNDLTVHNVKGRGGDRFKAVDAAALPPDDNIAAMSVAELKEYAAAEEIDIGDATKKADIAAVIRRSLVNGLVPAGA